MKEGIRFAVFGLVGNCLFFNSRVNLLVVIPLNSGCMPWNKSLRSGRGQYVLGRLCFE